MKPILAIIGRPNVGKSTLFNRIIGHRKALILDVPGVTRDRNFATGEWKDREFLCVDTGGFPLEEDSVDEKVSSQIDAAIDECDAILCVLDGQAGLIPEEERIVARLRKLAKPSYFAVNKIDIPGHEDRLNDFYGLGVPKLYPISAEHGYQVAELLDDVISGLPANNEDVTESHEEIRVAIIGRPNVGKSSLVNAWLGQSRVVVDDRPGTTRDSIDTRFNYEKHKFMLIDTAGMRRRSQKGGHLERLTILQTTRAIDRADICILLLSAEEGLSKQDAHIVGYVSERGKGLIIAWNKMDLSQSVDSKGLEKIVRDELPFISKVPVQFLSVIKGEGTEELLAELIKLHDELGISITTSKLNRIFQDLVENHSIPLHKGHEVKLYYATQVGTYPPLIVAFANHPQGIPTSYKRYLTRKLQDRLGLQRIPLRIVFRKRD